MGCCWSRERPPSPEWDRELSNMMEIIAISIALSRWNQQHNSALLIAFFTFWREETAGTDYFAPAIRFHGIGLRNFLLYRFPLDGFY